MTETESIDVFIEMTEATWDDIHLQTLSAMLNDAGQRLLASGLPHGRPAPADWSVQWKARPKVTEQADGQIRLTYRGTVEWETK